MRLRMLLLVVLTLTACNGSVTTPPEENTTVDPQNADLSEDVPDYAPFGAKVTGKSVEDGVTAVTMETINGQRSPLQFYRTKLPELEWRIVSDTSDDMHGEIVARKGSRTLTVNVTGKPDGAGADIMLEVEN